MVKGNNYIFAKKNKYCRIFQEFLYQSFPYQFLLFKNIIQLICEEIRQELKI